MSQSEAAIQADRQLAERCSAGEVAAWEELYGRFHSQLLAWVGLLLGPRGRDASLIDEIAARVWYALVKDDGRLLTRFEPRRHARLEAYIRGVTRMHTLLYFREEQRRRRREIKAGACQPLPALGLSAEVMLRDFADTLTADQRRLLEECLAASTEDGALSAGGPLADATRRRRGRTVMARLRAYFASP